MLVAHDINGYFPWAIFLPSRLVIRSGKADNTSSAVKVPVRLIGGVLVGEIKPTLMERRAFDSLAVVAEMKVNSPDGAAEEIGLQADVGSVEVES
jgi:hypothetical protein